MQFLWDCWLNADWHMVIRRSLFFMLCLGCLEIEVIWVYLRLGTTPSFSRQPKNGTNPKPLVFFCRCLHGPNKSQIKPRRSPVRTMYRLQTTMLRPLTHGRARTKRVSQSISMTRCSSTSTVRDGTRILRNGCGNRNSHCRFPFKLGKLGKP